MVDPNQQPRRLIAFLRHLPLPPRKEEIVEFKSSSKIAKEVKYGAS
jgi:hypothetical protein